jgi:hypothetical protein
MLYLPAGFHHLIRYCLLEQFLDIDFRMIFEPVALLRRNRQCNLAEFVGWHRHSITHMGQNNFRHLIAPRFAKKGRTCWIALTLRFLISGESKPPGLRLRSLCAFPGKYYCTFWEFILRAFPRSNGYNSIKVMEYWLCQKIEPQELKDN